MSIGLATPYERHILLNVEQNQMINKMIMQTRDVQMLKKAQTLDTPKKNWRALVKIKFNAFNSM